ncbi:MAG: SDR family oxidoreductase [Ectothiorhodospiraceae bacterium]|nr:SDR family oxidoreductase [Chromatiales bacterium]MCP5155440.1 SDR family oxidoreductase [Ectothiorhodospiraceae bacterium]
MSRDFTGKCALVTGAAGGMGLGVTLALLAAGARVAALDRQPRPAVLDDDAGGALLYCQGDLVDPAFVSGAVASAARATGRIDLVVNAAGVLDFARDRSLLSIDLDDWTRLLDANLRSAMLVSRHAAPLMRRHGGAMVHVSSIQCLRGDDRPQDAYQAAKGALLAMSRSLAIQLAPDRIRSNALLPGPTATPMQARWDDDPTSVERLAKVVPLGRVGRVEDMVSAILFLLSDDASWITGTELVVDGGLTARP